MPVRLKGSLRSMTDDMPNGDVKKRELASYRRILTRLYKAGIRHSHDPKLLKRQLMRRYKMACGLFYPSWRVWIHKRLFLVRLLAS